MHGMRQRGAASVCERTRKNEKEEEKEENGARPGRELTVFLCRLLFLA